MSEETHKGGWRPPLETWAERAVLLFVFGSNVAVGLSLVVTPLQLTGAVQMLAFVAVLVVSGLVSAVTVIAGRLLVERFRRAWRPKRPEHPDEV